MEKIIQVNNVYDFEKICRICLTETESTHPIDSDIAEKIYFCTSVKVAPIFLELFIVWGLFKNIIVIYYEYF